MRLDWISLIDFRSYQSLVWHPDSLVNLLIGANGAGKTNVLEAVGFLANLRSLRGAPEEALIEHRADSAVVRAEVTGANRSLIEIEIGRGRSRRAQVNGQRLNRTSELVGHLRVITFLPEDLDTVKRGPGYRRDFLDEIAVALAPAAHLDQSEFERTLRQRNAFLRQGTDDAMTLSVWDERLALVAGKVMSRRARAAAELQPFLIDGYRAISGVASVVEWQYGSEWGGALDPAVSASTFSERYGDVLVRRRRTDLERRMTTAGPHRDDPALLLDGHDLRHHGSQGEQRSTALALRLATHRAVSDLAGVAPILLLDDVFSELDPGRSAALASALPACQTMITTADRSDVPLTGTSWTVADASITPADQL